MAPMTRQFSPNGVPGENVKRYYQRRAAHEVGLIITEGTTVDHKAASNDTNIPCFHGDAALQGWKNVVDAVHAAGGKIAPQLWHMGSMRKPGTGAYPDYPSASPSGLVKPGKKVMQPLSVREIEQLIAAFANAAASAKELGFDAIELHGAHGYLLDTFFWQGTNIREDKYGGSIARRTQFAVEIIEAVREQVGEQFPIILRFSQWNQQDFSSKLVDNPDQLAEFLTPLSDAGVDIFHASNRRFWDPEFAGSSINLAGWTKQITGKPVISVGSVSLSEEFVTTYGDAQAEVAGIDELLNRMEAEEFDLIGIGRALIANPDWVELVKNHHMDRLNAFDKAMLARLE